MKESRSSLLSRLGASRESTLCVIACEGGKTEPRYFERLAESASRVHIEVLETRPDGSSSPQAVAGRLHEFRETKDLGAGDELWLVIDVDRWPPSNLDHACDQALAADARLAISNPCFELWWYLHYNDDTNCLNGMNCKRIRQHLDNERKTLRREAEYDQSCRMKAIDQAMKLDLSVDDLWPKTMGTRIYRMFDGILGELAS